MRDSLTLPVKCKRKVRSASNLYQILRPSTSSVHRLAVPSPSSSDDHQHHKNQHHHRLHHHHYHHTTNFDTATTTINTINNTINHHQQHQHQTLNNNKLTCLQKIITTMKTKIITNCLWTNRKKRSSSYRGYRTGKSVSKFRPICSQPGKMRAKSKMAFSVKPIDRTRFLVRPHIHNNKIQNENWNKRHRTP